MNNKGFTLVELLAMMTVLIIIVAIAVPNIAGIINNNRESAIKDEVERMERAAKAKLQTTATYPKNNNGCVVMTLNYIDNNEDFKKGVYDGGTYDKTQSIAVIKKAEVSGVSDTFTYETYIRLVETFNSGKNNIYVFEPGNNIDNTTVNSIPNGKRINSSDSIITVRTKVNNIFSAGCSYVEPPIYN